MGLALSLNPEEREGSGGLAILEPDDIEEKIKRCKLSLEKLHVLYERDLESKVLEETGIR